MIHYKRNTVRFTHGHTRQREGQRRRTPTYRSWESMWRRCTKPSSPDYKDYGARGITIDPRWRDFAVFLADLGERPVGMTLDRIDSDGNYEPGNCRWATLTQQLRNRSCVRLDMETVREIRLRYAAGGITQATLGAEYGVGRGYISRIVANKIWREEG